MRDVAVVSWAQHPSRRREFEETETQILVRLIGQTLERAGLRRDQIGFTCSGSCDYLTGSTFTFVMTLDATAAVDPIAESHVEMDGAWALYEAWVRLQHEDIDTALVYASGKSSLGDLQEVLALQLDPYYLSPLWVDPLGLAALQARVLLDSGKVTKEQMAEVAVRARRDALRNPNAQVRGEFEVGKLLGEPLLVDPLHKHDCPPISDSAAVVVLAAGDRARELCKRPAWIRGIDHRMEPHYPGVRDLSVCPSAALAADRAGVRAGNVDVAELSAPFTHQELLLREAMGLGPSVAISPSGGALAANPLMVTGLIRVIEAASRIAEGEASRALAHATSGPCLQQNLVCVLEGD